MGEETHHYETHSNKYAFKIVFKWALNFSTLAIIHFNNIRKLFQAGPPRKFISDRIDLF